MPLHVHQQTTQQQTDAQKTPCSWDTTSPAHCWPETITTLTDDDLQELLLPALRHFQAFGNTSASARCLLSLAQLECLVNQPEAALHLLQQLQQTGADVATSSRAVQCYAKLCMHLSIGRPSDAVLAVQSGIGLMEKLAV